MLRARLSDSESLILHVKNERRKHFPLADWMSRWIMIHDRSMIFCQGVGATKAIPQIDIATGPQVAATHQAATSEPASPRTRQGRSTWLLQAGVAWLLVAGRSMQAVSAAALMPRSPLPDSPTTARAFTLSARRLQQSYALGQWDPSVENTFEGEPQTSAGDDATLTAAPANASLFGPTGRPRVDHVRTAAFPTTGNGYTIAWLHNLARVAPDRLLSAITVVDAAARHYNVELRVDGTPTSVPVDARFYREATVNGSGIPLFEGLAYGLSVQTRAYWPGLMEKALVKAADSFPYRYLRPELLDFEGRPVLLSGDDIAGYQLQVGMLGRPIMDTLTAGGVDELRLDQVDVGNIAAIVQSAKAADSIAVLGLHWEKYKKSAAYNIDLDQLRFADGTFCTLPSSNQVLQPQCNLTDKTTVGLTGETGYILYDGNTSALVLGLATVIPDDPLVAAYDLPPEERNRKDGEPFVVPVNLLRNLNASIYFAPSRVPSSHKPSTTETPTPALTGEAPPPAPAAQAAKRPNWPNLSMLVLTIVAVGHNALARRGAHL